MSRIATTYTSKKENPWENSGIQNKQLIYKGLIMYTFLWYINPLKTQEQMFLNSILLEEKYWLHLITLLPILSKWFFKFSDKIWIIK